MGNRPGIMIYKDIAPAILRMDDDKAGKLFKAVLLSDDEEPEFEDAELRIAWAFISPRIREDAEKYKRISEKRRAAGQMGANASKCQQVPPKTKQLKTEQNKSEHKESKTDTRHKYGEYANVLLSDSELEKLKSEFPIDWEQRLERLSEYIASSGKNYKSHFATIRKWARGEEGKPKIELGGALCSL